MISRKRETEKAVLAALEAFATAGQLTGIKLYTSRQKHENEAASITVTCPRQSADGSLGDEMNTRMEVEGAIVATALVTNGAATSIEALEVLIETFIEQETAAILTAINAETATVLLTDIQPTEYEDGIDEGRERYVARYGFTAFVRTNPGE